MAHVRLRDRETPKGEIECQIGETVNPKKVCPKCAYATGCPSYEDWLEKDQYEPDLEGESRIDDSHKAVHPNAESKYCPFCIAIRLKRKLQYRYQRLKVWFDNRKLRYWCYE